MPSGWKPSGSSMRCGNALPPAPAVVAMSAAIVVRTRSSRVIENPLPSWVYPEGIYAAGGRFGSRSLQRARSVRRTARDERSDREGAEDEPADVREERDPASALRLDEREAAEPELEEEPCHEEEHRGDLDEEQEDERHDTGERMEHEVRAQNAGDRTARADVRDRRILRRPEPQRDRGLGAGRGDSRREVEG